MILDFFYFGQVETQLSDRYGNENPNHYNRHDTSSDDGSEQESQ
jgi:hypothetical protein